MLGTTEEKASIATSTLLPLQQGDYEYLAWLDDTTLVTQTSIATIKNFSSTQLSILPLTATEHTLLNLPPHPTCEGNPYATLLPRRTPTGQLAYVCQCNLSLIDGLKDYLMLYDPQSQTAKPLRADPLLPITATDSEGGINHYTLFRDLEHGFVIDSWYGATQLHRFDQTSISKVDLGVAVVGAAQLAPDGTQILATIQQKGNGSLDMLDRPYSIELIDPISFRRTPVLSGYNAHSITWSPDSRFVAIVAAPKRMVEDDIWLINAETGAYKRISTGTFNDIAWSPDGKNMAATRFVEKKQNIAFNGNIDTELILLDMASVTFP